MRWAKLSEWSESGAGIARFSKNDRAVEPDGADDQLDHRERNFWVAVGGCGPVGTVGAAGVCGCRGWDGSDRGLLE